MAGSQPSPQSSSPALDPGSYLLIESESSQAFASKTALSAAASDLMDLCLHWPQFLNICVSLFLVLGLRWRGHGHLLLPWV